MTIRIVGKNPSPLSVKDRIEPMITSDYINKGGSTDIFRDPIFFSSDHIANGFEKPIAAQHISTTGVQPAYAVIFCYIQKAPFIQIHCGVFGRQKEGHTAALFFSGNACPKPF